MEPLGKESWNCLGLKPGWFASSAKPQVLVPWDQHHAPASIHATLTLLGAHTRLCNGNLPWESHGDCSWLLETQSLGHPGLSEIEPRATGTSRQKEQSPCPSTFCRLLRIRILSYCVSASHGQGLSQTSACDKRVLMRCHIDSHSHLAQLGACAWDLWDHETLGPNNRNS